MTYRMKVHKYLPQKFFGFCIDEYGTQVFFHLNDFQGEGVAPIVGESVEVDADLKTYSPGAKAPKAKSVSRVDEPVYVKGTVEMFDGNKDYGFIKGDDDVTYHLHRSEVLENKVPSLHQRVGFYAGVRKDRPRACYVDLDLEE
ncbi:MAG: cold shock domain-containing protein [Bacteroidota bacterium]